LVAVRPGGADDSPATTADAETLPVVVASGAIAPGTTITADMLQVVQVPEGLALAGAFTEATPLVGQITSVSIAAGEQVLPSKVGPVIEGDSIGYVVPPGMRAVAISVDEVTAVGGLLLPGDRVDILGAFSEQEDSVTTVRTILQDVEILSVAQAAQEPIAFGPQTEGEEADPGLTTSGRIPEDVELDPGAGTITLLLNPQQAQMVIALQQRANIYLAARSVADHDTTEIGPNSADSSGVR
jgi:pilus assembly protein CpaB